MSDAIARPVACLPAGEDFLLLPPSQQPHAYANVDRIFATRPILRGPRMRALPRGAEIVARYRVGGRDLGIADYMRRANVAGLIVLSEGQIVLERYGLGLTEATRWSTMSTVKSLTSTLVGVALRQGRIGSLEDSVAGYLPALRGSAYDAVKVRHLLTMSSGVRWSEDYTDRNSDVNRYSKSLGDKVPGGVLALMRSLPPEAPPGTRFSYCTGDTYVLGCLVSAAMGEPLAETMSRSIWAPAGMEFDAYYTLESDGGQEIGGSRAGIALRDFARFGQFILDDGIVDGRRILPQGWVADAGSRHFDLDPATNSYGAVGYGYSWWIDPDGAMVAVGFAGQSIYVNRAAGVVIVTLACWPQPPYAAAYGIDFGAERRAFHRAVLAALGQGGAAAP
ncbi:beta-lactamase family protein [Roseomonas eburnea]|uniref:Beta-lactamase family protein n=1 Tax=Neoroseomonas eburnea TaxID=1346889 RepID=A0A9X9XF50_9PROT|nr:serine hydrolase [Neoroseomonas eburnea]MBR0682336.1 beta-lactamase family protein [Neoroseomonas eburnea]